MSLTLQIDAYVTRLCSGELSEQYSALSELVEALESFLNPKEYPYFLEKLVPVFIDLLEKTPVLFFASTDEHKVRLTVFEILQRLTHNETCAPHRITLLDAATSALRVENEENGVLCIKIITGIHKAYKNTLSERVQEFMDIIYEMYTNAPDAVQRWLNENSEPETRDAAETGELALPDDASPERELLPAMHSFKTLLECPITMVLLLLLYKQLVNSVLVVFIPKIIGLLELQAKAQEEDRAEAEKQGMRFTSVLKRIKNSQIYSDFIVSQVKATSFLAYIFIRDYAPDFFKTYHPKVPDLVVRLLQDCPSELAAAKKELLHATRHILLTPYKGIFMPKLDTLLDEKVLFGEGLTCSITLRALAYSAVADFVHNVRAKLTPDQLWKVVPLFCRVLQDDTLAVNVALMCAKLLLNLLEYLLKLPHKEARKLFALIIDTFVGKFALLNKRYDYYMALHRKYEAKKAELELKQALYAKVQNSKLEDEIPKSDDSDLDIETLVKREKASLGEFLGVPITENDDSEPIVEDPKESIVSLATLADEAPIQVQQRSLQPPGNDPLKDTKNLIRSLLSYLKLIISNMGLTNGPAPSEGSEQAWKAIARGFLIEEIAIFERLFEEALICVQYFGLERTNAELLAKQQNAAELRIPTVTVSASKEEKETMGVFLMLFTSIDPPVFGEIMLNKFPFLVEQMRKNPVLVYVPQLLLDNQVPSGHFSGTLIAHIKKKLPDLGQMDVVEANLYLKLFKFFLYLLNKFPEQNERFLLPHVNDLILQALEHSRSAKEPMVYFHFVRILFKSISRGRFEELYKEVVPLLQKTLGLLNKLIESARTRQERDICIELCLTIPVRLSKLVLMLHFLMRPLVLALNGLSELVGAGLRTLELCVDNFNPSYFDPIIEPVIGEIMAALWRHLQPASAAQHGDTVVRILGKFGGRNRSSVKPVSDLEVANVRLEAAFDVKGLESPAPISVATGIDIAVTILEDARTYPPSQMVAYYCMNAYKYLSSIILLFVDASPPPTEYVGILKAAADSLTGNVLVALPSESIRETELLDAQRTLVERILKALFSAAQVNELTDAAGALVCDLSRHVAQLYVGKSVVRATKAARGFSVEHGEGRVFLDVNIYLNVVAYALSSAVPEVRELGVVAIRTLCDTVNTLFGLVAAGSALGLQAALIAVFCHSCYDEMYYNKQGGVLGIRVMFKESGIPTSWFVPFQKDLVRALFFVLRDALTVAPTSVITDAEGLLEGILMGCNQDMKSIDDLPGEMVSSLVYDLASLNAVVRRVARKLIALLAEIVNIPRKELVLRCKNVLLGPIFAKPLRALPFLMQIGHIEAVTYWLDLPQNDSKEFTEEMQRLMLEVVSLVEAEDLMLASREKLVDCEVREQLTDLRVVCIKLLSVALSRPDYAMTQPGLTRLRILAVFFKTLSSQEKAIVDASHEGLRAALAQNNKLPKDLLQTGLRPMLMNLSDHRKLTVLNLETLARLLVVLMNYFKVEIGQKLLHHANSWATPQILSKVARYDLLNNSVIEIINAIFNIFHLLPPKAYTFIPDVLTTLVKIEHLLRRIKSSPCRASLESFLDRYPEECSDFFFSKIADRKFQDLHAYYVAHCSLLREKTRERIRTLFDLVQKDEDLNLRSQKFVSFLDILEVASREDEWIGQQEALMENVFETGKVILHEHLANTEDRSCFFEVLYAQRKLQTVMITFFSAKEIVHPLFFSMIDFFFTEKLTCAAEVGHFVLQHLVLRGKMVNIQEAFGTLNSSLCIDAKVYLLKQICVASVVYEGERNKLGSLIDGSPWLEAMQKIWKTPISEHTAGAQDIVRLELLQLTTALIKYTPEQIAPLKTSVIMYIWSLMRLEDTVAKHCAYLAACHFISRFETPTKITTHMLFALLRASNVDVRYLVKQGLDLLANAAKKSILDGATNIEDWTVWPRRALQENNSTSGGVYSVFRFVAEHEDLFFPVRSEFTSGAIGAIGKLTLLPLALDDFQALAVELSEIVIKWEARAHRLKSGSEPLNPLWERTAESKMSYEVPSNQREAFMTFLVRHLCMSTHRILATEFGARALALLFEAAQLWPETAIPLGALERFLVADVSGASTSALLSCVNTLEVLGVLLECRDHLWIISHLGSLHRLVSRAVKSANMDVQEALQRVLRIILKAIRAQSDEGTEPEEAKTFMNMLAAAIAADFSNTTLLYAGTTLFLTVAHVHYQPQRMSPLLLGMVKTFGKLCKDYLALRSQRAQENSTQVEEEARITAKLIRKLLDVSATRISYFSEQRRAFLLILALFADKAHDKDLMRHIVQNVSVWVFLGELVPTAKEKSSLIAKILGFELRREAPITVVRECLRIVVRLFEEGDPKTAELRARLERAFLMGTKFIDVGLRQRFMRVLGNSVSSDIRDRLLYVVQEQSWDDIGDFPWLVQALELLLGSFEQELPVELDDRYYRFAPLLYLAEIVDPPATQEAASDSVEALMKAQNAFLQRARNVKARDITSPLVEVLHNDVASIKLTWEELFPVAYQALPQTNKVDFTVAFTNLLSKDYHSRLGANNVQALLAAACRCKDLEIPPHLVKYLGMAFNAHYLAIEYLEERLSAFSGIPGPEEYDDALIELYLALGSRDMYYGLWRRRAKFNVTNTALLLEQVGMLDTAMKYYESAQIKTRTRSLPYSASEYGLWEDLWIACAEKLQHWDVLTELSKHENYTDLLLECGWRVANWNDDKEPLEQSVKTLMDLPTPRRHIFKTFLCLQDFAQQKKLGEDVEKLCDEGVQLALKSWTALPSRFTGAHVELLHVFQQYVEFREATHIYSLLVTTNTQNIEAKLLELKRVLQLWRERLPNIWDDINVWNDLINWRQHFFQLVNGIYTPFLKPDKANTYLQLYCGFHEIACVINRFAHVARKHGFDEVCILHLSKIYLLPNIEIMEAFLKLIEQVKCHYQNDKELYAGLEVISNTNLAYFGTTQKAEFFVLKGMFLAKLGNGDGADHAFGTAIQLDSNLAKAWAKWGAYHYTLFKQSKDGVEHAKNALICFLHAVGLYKNSKSRRYLALILWLISLDDEKGTLAAHYLGGRVEVPVWYWITYIPQLLTLLLHKEAEFARRILMLIAKLYPQALHFPLRTTKEDFLAIQKQISLVQKDLEKEKKAHSHPWEHIEEIMNISKTLYPLLALSLESLVAQITSRFKSSFDEDAYRLVAALYSDGMQLFNRMLGAKGDGTLPAAMVENLRRFGESVLTRQVRAEFEKDFIRLKPNYETYIRRLIRWKERFENKLDRRVLRISLENLCPHLVEFHYLRFEDIDVPGQYLLNKDTNKHFLKIDRFLPTIEIVRGFNGCYKRLKMRAKDGSVHEFAVQFPLNRHLRREERIFQLFRLFDGGVARNVQCRSRNIAFTLPVAVALSPHIRLFLNDPSDITLQEVYERTCKKKGQPIEEPFFYITEKLKATFDFRLPKPDIISTMTEIFLAVQTLFVPSTMVHDYFAERYARYEDFWLFRKQFTLQYALFILMTHMMSITSRQPQKIHIGTTLGSVWTLELLPNKTGRHPKKEDDSKIPVFNNPEAVPFRLSPNIQKLIGTVGLEGILSVHVLVIARCLANPQFDIENFLSLFVRDEVISWFAQNLQTSAQGPHLREIVKENVDLIVTKLMRIDHPSNINPVATHNVNELIANAVNPRSLAQLDYLWRPYL